jgi:8-oxo-dGTP pyrophosphatase MutT (NUDIX family)
VTAPSPVDLGLYAWEEGLHPRGHGGKFAAALEDIKARHPHVQLHVGHTEGSGHAKISLIRTPESERGKGHAGAVMRELTKAADSHGVHLTLTPEPLAGDRKTSKAKLTAWYKSHGFVENKGKNKDYEISESMHRPPRSVTSSAAMELYAIDPHSRCEEDFCLATRKPGICKGVHHPGTAIAPPKVITPPRFAPVPNAPAAKTDAQRIAQEQAAASYTAAVQHAQGLAQQLGARGGQRHAGVQAAVRDYAGALHKHGQAIQAEDKARVNAQKAHDTAQARNAATQAHYAAQVARANARAHAVAKHAALKKAVHKAVHGAKFPLTYPSPAGFSASGWAAEADLYALPGAEFEELYALVAASHWMCGVDQFCRNPLHPGPCKGWKHTLHAVAPGAYHAYEKDRVAKANTKREAKIRALQALGSPVPKSLLKPITYTAPTKPQPGFTPPSAQGAKDVLADISSKVTTNVPVRAAQLTDAKTGMQAQSMHDVVSGVQGKTGVVPGRVKIAMAKIKAGQPAGAKLTDHPLMQDSITGLVDKIDKKVGGLDDKTKAKLHADISSHVEAGTPGMPQSVKDELAKAPTPSVPAAPAAPSTPPAPPAPAGPAGTRPVHVQHAVNVAHRGAQGSHLAKVHMEAYGKLGKSEFDALPDRIRKDLDAARAKFLDPKKRVEIDKTINRLDPMGATGTPGKPATPSAPSAPSSTPTTPSAAMVAKGYSDRVNSAVTAARSGSHGDAVTHAAGLSRPELAQMDNKDRQIVLDRLATIGRLGFPNSSERARELHRIATTTSVPSETSRKWDHAPSFGELAAEEAKTGKAPVFPALDKLKSEKDPQSIPLAFSTARMAARGNPQHQAELEKHRAALVADTSLPLWLRARMLTEAESYQASIPGDKSAVRMAQSVATELPSRGGQWFPTLYKVEDLYAVDQKHLAQLPPVLREAILERRNEGVAKLIAAGGTDGAVSLIFRSLSGGYTGRDRFDALEPATQNKLRKAIEAKIGAGLPDQGSRNQKILDVIDNTKYNAHQQTAIDISHDTYASRSGRLAVYGALSDKDLAALPAGHRDFVKSILAQLMFNSPTQAERREARHIAAKWDGIYPSYSDPSLREAVLSATIDKHDTDPADRAANYLLISKPAWANTLDVGDRKEILADMQNLADGVGPTVSADDRYSLQRRIDRLTDQNTNRHAHVLNVINAIDPLGSGSLSSKVQEFDRLTTADYASLPKAYAEIIDRDLAAVASTNTPAYTALMARFHPGWTPPHAPTPAITKTNAPNVQAALDTIYGLHPKAHTTAHQLATYGGLKTADFHQLNAAEQSHLLGDLSYIKTTAKGANATKADRLIGYFTPPGTPLGTIPNQPVNIPANAVAGQSRVTDPLGTPGLMKQATDKGTSGDGWTRKTDGTTGPWGKHGAAGVMLRHIGSDGQTRYLMIERGPGISDPGKWQFPGGAIDSKETPHQGATRETIEELGFKASDLDGARVHGEHVFAIHGVVGPPGGEWKYTTIAATVPKQLTPDLSTHHARAETSDAKWMTADEIKQLDKKGKLLSPLAGGKLEQNVMSLFPAAHAGPVAPGPVTKKLPRLSVPKPVAHKPSKGVNLLTDKTAIDKLRQDVKQARKNFSGKVYDDRLGAIMAMQGFDDTPTVATKAEIDRLLATGDYIEVWRGVNGGGGKSAAKINEEFRSGPAWNGRGVFGNGYYFATDKSIVRQYSDGTKNSVMRALIPKTALVDTHEKLAKEAEKIAKPQSQAKGGRYEVGTLYDPGRYAAAKGLDGIRIDPIGYQGARGMSSHHVAKPGKPAYNWLNRSVLIVQEAE